MISPSSGCRVCGSGPGVGCKELSILTKSGGLTLTDVIALARRIILETPEAANWPIEHLSHGSHHQITTIRVAPDAKRIQI